MGFINDFPIDSGWYVLKNKHISPSAKTLYMLLRQKQRQEGPNIEVSLADMAEMLLVSKPSVIKYKRELINAKVLKETTTFRESGGKGTSIYEVVDTDKEYDLVRNLSEKDIDELIDTIMKEG